MWGQKILCWWSFVAGFVRVGSFRNGKVGGLTSRLVPLRLPSRYQTNLELYRLSPEQFPESVPSEIFARYTFSLLEVKDLNQASQFALEAFYTPRLILDTGGTEGFELWLLNGLKEWYSKMDRSDTFNGNYLGFRSRSASRLSRPSLVPSCDSFILVATSQLEDSKIAGMVEICLEVADGKLAPPIQLPWKGKLTGKERPYLCNLCIDPNLRRQGLGMIMVKMAEKLVIRHWNQTCMYLHVERKNTPAQALYSKMNYTLVTANSVENNKVEEEEMAEIEYGESFTTYPDISYFFKRLSEEW